jgi:hypothetical protein
MKSVIYEVDKSYENIVERYAFEYSRSVSNVKFLMGHIDDVNSELLQKYQERMVQARADLWSYQTAIAEKVIKDNNGDLNYRSYKFIHEAYGFMELYVIY